MTSNNNSSLLNTEKRIGCAWGSEVGKVVGRFIVLPIKKVSIDQNIHEDNSDNNNLQFLFDKSEANDITNIDKREYYLCEFLRFEFIRIYGNDNKYIKISQLPEVLQEEVINLLGSTKIINSDVLSRGTAIYIKRPGKDSQ